MREKLRELERHDTPSITNVVATYPQKDFCLGLYHPWEGRWYTDSRLRCMFPEMGRRAGYAVTCVYGIRDPQFSRLGIGDVLRAIGDSPKPVILAIKQDIPEPFKSRSGLIGGNMMTAFKSAGVTAVLSDGPSRDVDEIRSMGLQYLITGVTPGHGDYGVKAVSVPVEICGMDVMPGEIVHLDENGAVKFPADRLADVLAQADRLAEIERKKQELLRATGDIGELTKIIQGIFD